MSEHLLVQNIPGFKRPTIYERHTVLADSEPAGEESHQQGSQVEKATGEVIAATGTVASDLQASKILHKGAKQQRTQTGRKFTSQFRGVHQTFPTRRWEAQFRRGGRPTSLGCFDEEGQAAQAYDRMMLWCHLHGEFGSLKHGITNYDMKEYESEYEWLSSVTQEDLIESLRCHGRKQAASRQIRNKQSSGTAKSQSQDVEADTNVDADKSAKSGSTEPAAASQRNTTSEEPAGDSTA